MPTLLEILDLIVAAIIVYVELGIFYVNRLVDRVDSTLAAAPQAIRHDLNRRMGKHPNYTGEGIMFLCYFNMLASIGTLVIWAYRVREVTVLQLGLHLVYSVLTSYCATIEFLDLTVGEHGHMLFPFEAFPLVVAAVIFALLALESLWIQLRARPHHPIPGDAAATTNTTAAAAALDSYTVDIGNLENGDGRGADVPPASGHEANRGNPSSSAARVTIIPSGVVAAAGATGLRHRAGNAGAGEGAVSSSSTTDSSSGYHTATD